MIQSSVLSQVINAYSSGVQAHKELLRKNGLTPDAVEDMIDEVHEVGRFFRIGNLHQSALTHQV